MKKQNSVLITLIVAIVVGAVGFYGGMMYQKHQLANNVQFASGANGAEGGRFFRQGVPAGVRGAFGAAGMQPVRGQIISADSNSITVKMQDGSSKIVAISDKTTINKSTQGSKTDLTTGQEVTAFGTKNSDGSINAQIVSLGTGMGMMRGGQPAQPTQAQQ